ncbi:hypothetical protein [Brevundimonas sp.]|uniref:hypothetical protein n=1 Tax=Brevundimonas sp. TaxID=1871086 RepID=UPI003D6D0325
MFRYLRGVVVGAPIVMIATVAAAQVAPEAPTSVPGAPLVAAAIGQVPARVEDEPKALSLEELEEESGRQGIYIYAGSNQNLSAVNSGNTIKADSVGSGNIALTEGAFAGFAGIGNFVVNSGHNNNLQGSLSIILVTPQ